jgi:hypothetical protein
MALKIRRGSDIVRQTITPSEGELLYTTDTKKIFVGDGSTLGGTEVSGVNAGDVGSVAFYSTTTEISSGTNISWNNSTNVLAVDKGSINVNNESRNRDLITIDAHYASPLGSSISLRKSKGSAATPTIVANSEELGNIYFSGCSGDTNLYQAVGGLKSQIDSAPVVAGAAFAVDFVSKTGTGPYYVTFSFVTQGSAPIVSRNYTITGNENVAYNSSRPVYSSTTSSMVLVYSTDPGVYGAGATTASMDAILTGGLTVVTGSANGNLLRTLRVSSSGLFQVGPNSGDYAGIPYDSSLNGQIAILSTKTLSTQSSTSAQLTLRTFADTTYSQSMNIVRSRGTVVANTPVVSGDQLHVIKWLGTDGATSVSAALAAQLTVTVDTTVSSGKVPGAITFSTTNASSGALVAAVKIDSAQKTTFSGAIQVDGTINTAKAPGTFYNYDSSSSTITMTLGQTLAFSNFSGKVLVNCYNSGTVTEYFCGGGSAPRVSGSSKVTNTGTMAYTSGISGYTFTSTEAGVHSFYVIRTRTGA